MGVAGGRRRLPRHLDEEQQRRDDGISLARQLGVGFERSSGDCRPAARYRGAATSPVRVSQRPPRRRFVSLAAVSPVSYARRHDADAPLMHISTAGRAWRRGPQRQP